MASEYTIFKVDDGRDWSKIPTMSMEEGIRMLGKKETNHVYLLQYNDKKLVVVKNIYDKTSESCDTYIKCGKGCCRVLEIWDYDRGVEIYGKQRVDSSKSYQINENAPDTKVLWGV